MSDENSPQARAAFIVAQWNVYHETQMGRTPEKAQALEELITAELGRREADAAALLAERAQLLWIARRASRVEQRSDYMIDESLSSGLSAYRADYGEPWARYDELCDHMGNPRIDHPGAALLADLRNALRSRDTFQDIIRDAARQIGDARVPLPVAIATLKSELAATWRALEVFYQMIVDLKAALDAGAEQFDCDPYVLRVAGILKETTAAQQTTTTPEEAGRQAENAMRIARQLSDLFGEEGASNDQETRSDH